MRVLLIGGNAESASALHACLSEEGLNLSTAHSADEGFDLARLYDYDMVLIKTELPDMCGRELLSKLRTDGIAFPVLIIGNASHKSNKIKYFRAGADDYLEMPFDYRELAARIRAVVRRYRGFARSIIKTGKITLDLDEKSLSADGKTIPLTGKEYKVFELLSLRKNTALTKDMMLDHLYGGLDEPNAKIINVFVCKIRRKILKATGENYIETVWGRGYVLRGNNTPMKL